MNECSLINPDAPFQYVGDPVDVVSGANAFTNLDFQLQGPIPFQWRRHYDSSRNEVLAPLGWGHAHDFDHRLRFDLDGISYVRPVGQVVGFPALRNDGEQLARGGYRLRRAGPRQFILSRLGSPEMEFVLGPGQTTAPLKRLLQAGSAIEFEYARDGSLSGITDSLGRRIRVECDARGRIASLTMLGDRPGNHRVLLACRYDAEGNLVEQTDPYRNTFRFKYDPARRMVAKTDRRGYTFSFEYDSQGRCVHSWGEDGQEEVRLEYLPEQRLTVVTRADGGRWHYYYDAEGRLVRIIDPEGGATSFVIDQQGRLVAEVDARGNRSRILHRADGSIAGKITPLGQFTAYPDAPDAPDPLEHQMADCPLEWEYGKLFPREHVSPATEADALDGNLPAHVRKWVRTAPPPPDVERTESPSGGWKEWDPRTRTLKEYDLLGLLIRETGPGGRVRTWSYDPAGYVHRYRDWDGGVYETERRSWNLVTRQTDPIGGEVVYAYTPTRKIASLTDAGGTRSEFAYDAKDRLVEVRRHGVTRERYLYDEADNLVQKLDGQGNRLLRFEVGQGNRKVVRELASGDTHTFKYDEAGRMVLAACDHGEVVFAYDERGKLIRDERDGKGVVHRFGWVAARAETVVRSTTILGRFRVEYEYPDSRTLVLRDPGGHAHRVRFLRGGMVMRTMSNRSREVAQFDPQGRCLFKARDHRLERDHPWSQLYHYSDEGDLLRAEDSRLGTTSYRYDAAHRLVEEVTPDGERLAYELDAAGNLLRKPGLREARLMEGNRLREANGRRYEYNARNHVASCHGPEGATSFTYDSRDMLVRIDRPDGTWEATYDPLGRRISKTWQGGRREFYWDSDRLVAEIDEAGRLRIYIYPSPEALTPMLFMEYDGTDADPRSGKLYFVYSNQIGAPVCVENEHGQVVWQARLEPYGTAQVRVRRGVSMPLRFPGHYHDEETGLHYNRFRYYDPGLGRYLQSDPLGLAGGLNLYAYPADPLTRVDLRGTDPCPACEAGPKKAQEDGIDHENLPNPSAIPKTNRPEGSKPFGDLPPLEGRPVNEVRKILKDAGFHQTQHERTQSIPVYDEHGNVVGQRTVTDSRGGSEIWMRRDQDDNYEAVRIDQHGHERPKTMPADQEFAGEPAHVHREAIPNDPARRDAAQKPPWEGGGNMFEPGSTAGDAADRYNSGFSPGIYDTYDDNGNPTATNDFPANHTHVKGPHD